MPGPRGSYRTSPGLLTSLDPAPHSWLKGAEPNMRLARRALPARADQDFAYLARCLLAASERNRRQRLSRIPGGLPSPEQPHLGASGRTRVGSVASLATRRASQDELRARILVHYGVWLCARGLEAKADGG